MTKIRVGKIVPQFHYKKKMIPEENLYSTTISEYVENISKTLHFSLK
jgi:hypothetical protein